MNSQNDILKIFNIGNTNLPQKKYNEKLNQFISEKDFNKLIKRHDQFSDTKSSNISNKITEKQKIIRLKIEGSTAIEELYKELKNMGLTIPYSTLADFLILKAMNKI